MKSTAGDVVFVFPPGLQNVGAFRNHLGVAYLRAVLAREGIATTQYRQKNPGTIHRVADDILRLRPKVVGFTVYDTNFPLTLVLARRLKEKQPGLRIVVGGPTATFGAVQILEKHSVIDACVISETEETGPQIFKQLLGGSDFDPGQPGLACRRDGTIVCSHPPALAGSLYPDTPAQSALDTLPSPYLSGILTSGRPGVLTSRGCTHHCQYCVFAALARKTLRLHSIERVLAELEFIACHQRRTRARYIVSIHDDTFSLLPTRAKALCRAIAERHLNLRFTCLTRADRVDDELLRLMRDAGFVNIVFGLESAVPSVLRATGKVRPPNWPDPDLTPEREFIAQVRRAVFAAKKQGLHVGVSIILGLPSETPEDGDATLRFVKALPLDDYAHNFIWTFPGTPLYDNHDRYGIACSVDTWGLATTTGYAYDVTRLRPRPKCVLEEDARSILLLTSDTLYACEAPWPCRSRIGAVVIKGCQLPVDTVIWLGHMLGVGGLVVQVYPPRTRCESVVQLYRDRSAIYGSEVFPRFHTQLVPKTADPGHERWLLACLDVDLYRTHKPKVLTLEASDGPAPLLEWINGRPTTGALCDVTDYLRRPSELIRFLDLSNDDDISRKIRGMPFPPGLKYPGRWLRGRVPCRTLSRLEVDNVGTVRTCGHGKPIGTIRDTKRALTGRLIGFIEESEHRRGCADCPSTHCPRCPFPGLDEQVYCRVMIEQTRSLSFLNWIRFYSRLPVILAAQRGGLESD